MSTSVSLSNISSLYSDPPVVKVENRNIPEVYGWTNAGTFRENVFMVDMARGYSNKYVNMQVTYKDGSRGAFNTPYDYKVEVLEGEEAAQFRAALEPIVMSQMHERIPHGFYIGTDVVMPVINKKTGKLVPADRFLRKKGNANYTIQYDGHSNTADKIFAHGLCGKFYNHIRSCLEEEHNQISAGLRSLRELSFSTGATTIGMMAVVEFPEGTSPEEKKALRVTNNSKNIYGIKPVVTEPDFQGTEFNMHFNVSDALSGSNKEIVLANMVKALDAITAVSSVCLLGKYDEQRRRTHFGLVGDYKIKSHGFEYSVLPGTVLCHPMVSHLVYDIARKAVVIGQKNYLRYWQSTEAETVDCVMQCDVEKAREIVKRNETFFRKILSAIYGQEGVYGSQIDFLFNMVLNGFETVIEEPLNYERNWMINEGWNNYGRSKNVSGCMKKMRDYGTKKF